MSREIVRNMGSGMTHLADVKSTTAMVRFGAPYRKPPSDTRALCGVHIKDGVVMREGSTTRCRACLFAAEREGQR